MVMIGLIVLAVAIAIGLTLIQKKELSLLDAVIRRDPNKVELLLKQGVDPNEKYGRDESPYDVALRMGDKRVIAVMERYNQNYRGPTKPANQSTEKGAEKPKEKGDGK